VEFQHRRALDLVVGHCDIAERLRDVPPSARTRGLYFNSIATEVKKARKGGDYASYFPGDRHVALSFYPLSDYLIRLAVAGALVAAPADVHAGMSQITSANATAFSSSLLGRILLRLLSRDPVRLAQQALAARRQSSTYGEWTLHQHGPRELEMVYRGEFIWIESAVAGSAAGTFAAGQIDASLETKLVDRYDGSTVIRW
jgi:uncharacterized protein (TIGR02265 family)